MADIDAVAESINEEEGSGNILKLNLKFNLTNKRGNARENGSHAVDKRYDASNNPSKMSFNNNDNSSLSPPVPVRDVQDGPGKQDGQSHSNQFVGAN